MKNMSIDYIAICATIENICKKYNSKAYLIGGFVRNYLFQIFKHKVLHEVLYKDIDIAVECSKENENILLQIIYEEIKKYSSLHCSYFSEHYTIKAESSCINIDVAYTRRERHISSNSVNPEITISYSIKEDIFRRDFRCNTLALPLEDAIDIMQNFTKQNNIYEISHICKVQEENKFITTEYKIDPIIEYIYLYNKEKSKYIKIIGVENSFNDCKNKILCSIHERSFYDDSTRILRMLSFLVQFSMNIEKKTYFHMQKALGEGCFEKISFSRIKKELNKNYIKNNTFLVSKIYIKEKITQALFFEYTLEEESKLLFLIKYIENFQYKRILSAKEEKCIVYCIFSGDFLERSIENPKKYMQYLWQDEEYATLRKALENCRKEYSKECLILGKEHTNTRAREYIYTLLHSKKLIECIYILLLVDTDKKKLVEDFIDVCYSRKGRVLVLFEEVNSHFPCATEDIRALFYKKLTRLIFIKEAYSKDEQYTIALQIVEELLLEK